MSGIQTGTVTEIKVVPYDITKVQTINANLSYSPYNYNNIVENCKEIKETLILSIQEDNKKTFPFVERISDLGITSSWFSAIDCLAVGLYEPSVLFASISVECILNHDMRLEQFRQNMSYTWIDLNWQNLKYAHDNGLPTNLLLNVGETFSANMEFVMRRNKVAHGDIEGYSNMYPAFFDKGLANDMFDEVLFDIGNSRPSKEHALGQIEKAKRFIVEWARPNPKVRIH